MKKQIQELEDDRTGSDLTAVVVGAHVGERLILLAAADDGNDGA